MRLTLRTLLAYLDDTLDAGEIKEIGQKVAESDAAQELIARIKQVTRRRRLTTPPMTGPNARFEPNDIAEYLDNVLSSEQLAEIEKLALESDVHLAEIAACHQILTLVLGEPALVPPKSREKMYGLVHGREAIPFRKATNPRKTEAEEDAATLGGGWMRWVLPVAGVLLVVALGGLVWQIMGDRKDRRKTRPDAIADISDTGNKETDKGKKPDTSSREGAKKEDAVKEGAKKDGDKKPIVKEGGKKDGDKKPVDRDPPTKTDKKTAKEIKPPSKARKDVGTYIGGLSDLPSVLIAQEAGKDSWKHITRNSKVYSSDTLISLPGYTSRIQTPRGASAMLRGHLRDFSIIAEMDYLLDSAVIFHVNPDFDMDLTLLRGRVYLRNDARKGSVSIRLRFETETWDLTLDKPGTEVGIDLMKRYTTQANYVSGDPPHADLILCVLNGEIDLKTDPFQTESLEAPEGNALYIWNNETKASGPHRLKKLPDVWTKVPKPRDEVKVMVTALKDLATLVDNKKEKDPKDPVVAIKECLEMETRPAMQVLGIYCLAAIGDPGKLYDVLNDSTDAYALLRGDSAVFALRRWVSQKAGQQKVLYDAKNRTGVLIDKKCKPGEAETIVEMLHFYKPEDWRNADTFKALAKKLSSNKVAISQLAYWHLMRMAYPTKLDPFNPVASKEKREEYTDYIENLIAQKKLPPRLPEKPDDK